MTEERFQFTDWEPEHAMTGDGKGDQDKYILTIQTADGDEWASIIHRTDGGRFPLDGPVAEEKMGRAQLIVAALNATYNA